VTLKIVLLLLLLLLLKGLFTIQYLFIDINMIRHWKWSLLKIREV
jgi:hypothetical protein